MNYRTIENLEFDKILNILLSYCSTYIGRAICQNTKISFDINEVEKRLKEVTQIQNCISKLGSLPITDIANIDLSLKKANIDGILSFKELLDVAHVLKISREIKEYFFKETEYAQTLQYIYGYFDSVYTNIRIEQTIFDNILDENTINDKASNELYTIRKKIKQNENKIRDTLSSYISSPNFSQYLQDNIITMRNGRFVIPVKQEYKNMIKGLVHDMSSSGSTLFIEPNNIVELNNNIKELMIEENKEIEKILYEYSKELSKISSNILDSVSNLGYIDFLNAKAKYSLDNNMYEPNINSSRYIRLVNARHPLIDNKVAVPISLEISNNYNTMIITGPNTGGKTVTLKTIGLLTLMTQYGMHIPANENSNICIFKNIFTDIGDEQNIEQNLSTFSAHITNIVKICNNVNSNSLVILDELGSGTDPIEGSAIARGILEFLNTKNCITLCSTHYSELKTFAMSKENILNASTEFNVKTLKPTYKLIMGIPGKSNAFAISQKLGLNSEILENASKYITKDNTNFEDILEKIRKEQNEIEKIKRNIQSEYGKIKAESEYILKQKEELESKKDKILSNAKKEARNLLLSTKQEINDILKEAENLKSKPNISKGKISINKNINEKILAVSKNDTKTTQTNESNINISDLKVGQTIYILSLKKEGTIYAISNNTIKVQIGIIKTNVDLTDIKLIDTNNSNSKLKKGINVKLQNTSKNVSTKIDVMGLNVDEAIFEIDKFLDTAYINHLSPITILHGKGTGKLKSGIHAFLKTNKYVKSYRIGDYHEGQDGVTIVELK
mgnify:CR=1 FL=1